MSHEMTHQRPPSLVQYNTPEMAPVDEEDIKVDFEKAIKCELPPIDAEKQLQNIMDCLLPPRYAGSLSQ